MVKNCFKILETNETEISCVDILTDDFVVFSKTEHKFELFDAKKVLISSLWEALEEINISVSDKIHIQNTMIVRFDKWL